MDKSLVVIVLHILSLVSFEQKLKEKEVPQIIKKA